MESQENDAPQRIANSFGICAQIRALAGISGVFFFPFAIARFLDSDWRGLGFLVPPAAALALARWIEHATPKDAALLYPDKLEIPRLTGPARIFRWSDVTSLRWPKIPNDERAPVRLVQLGDAARPADQAVIDLADVSPTDRLVLIKYLHRAGAAVEQENWGVFCRNLAVPLAETLEGGNAAGASERTATPRWLKSIERDPFLTGLLAPIAVAYLLPKAVSRTTYWSLAAIISVSAWINIRLVWGRWESPFAEICLGAAALCFLFGVFSPDRSSQINRIASPLALIAWYVPALILCPFIANAAFVGWLPRQFGRWAIAGIGITLFGPAIQRMWTGPRQRLRRRKLIESLQADAERRWAVYQATGSLPPPAPEEAPGSR